MFTHVNKCKNDKIKRNYLKKYYLKFDKIIKPQIPILS
jgi:hypothetical protein